MASRYRADQVDSLLRPKELLEAMRSGASAEKLNEFEDQQILRALRPAGVWAGDRLREKASADILSP